MSRKLSVKLTAYILLVMFTVAAAVGVVYIANQKSIYIDREKTRMSRAFIGINECKFASEKVEIDTFLENYEDQVYNVVICNADFKTVYSSNRRERTVDIKKRKVTAKADLFSYDAVPVYENIPGESERIVLRKLTRKNGNEYYVMIEESLKTSDAVFSYTNKFMLYMIVLFAVISGFVVFLLVSKMTKSVSRLSTVAEKISQKDYKVRYENKITSDEIGTLAININKMADTIQKNINDLNNYNFLLKEDNNRMSEYESMRKRVLGNVTHELKTPLAIISSQVEMIKCSTDEAKREYYYRSALEEIEKMSKLISRFLNFSAGEKEIFKEEIKRVNLSEKITDLCKSSGFYIKKNSFKFGVDIEPECYINISPNHIEHIFNNYLMNAMSHVFTGGKIKVTLKKYDDVIRLSVYNDGRPIDDEEKEAIWTDFYKTTASAQSSTGSAGLGLFIVKEISVIDRTECGFINHDNGVEFWFDFSVK